MPDSKLMGAQAAADVLGIDKSTLIRWIVAGKIAAEKLDGPVGAYVLAEAAVYALRDELTAQAVANG